MQNEFGYDEILHFENHVDSADPFTIPATTARYNWYGAGGFPKVRFDGGREVLGGSSTPPPGGCTIMGNNYRTKINARKAETGSLSPISITGTWNFTGASNVKMDATFKLVDPVTLTSLRATFIVYEDNVTWCCGYGGASLWQHNTRAIYDQNITLASAGDSVNVSGTVPLNAAWNRDEMHVVAYVQQTTGLKEIYQGAILSKISDFTIAYDNLVRSVPNMNGPAFFNATLTNIGASTDTITVEPSVQFGSWATEYFIGNDPTPQTGATDVILDPTETQTIKIMVSTDGTKEVRSGAFHAISSRTAREDLTTLRVYNGSYSVLLVDDDSTYPYELPLENALNNLGVLFSKWDIAGAHSNLSPKFADMSGFDHVIWHSGWRVESLLSDADMANLMTYMDRGGSLFLSSQSFLNQLGGVPNTFVTNYLGVASWTLDKGYAQLDGVAGDVIGNGITLPLTFQYPTWKKGDDAVPGATAATSFLAPDGSHAAIRNTMPSGAKSVFMPSAWNAISETDPDPNNTKILLGRILVWLRPPVAADVQDGQGSTLASRITLVRPNPFGPRTEISFSLSGAGAAGPVQLLIFDLGGRKIATLTDGTLTAGTYVRAWDGRTDAGVDVGSGIYFARLTTREGNHNEKLIVLK
jgi:hypothetical protein